MEWVTSSYVGSFGNALPFKEEMVLKRSGKSRASHGGLPYETVLLILGDPQAKKSDIEPGGRIAILRWGCGCRAIHKDDICNVDWCLAHIV